MGHGFDPPRLGVIRSDRSRQMGACEQIAQVAHIKRVTVSDSLRSLRIHEQMSDSINIFWLKSYFLVCYTVYTFFYLKNERFAHSLFFNE